MHGMYVHVLLLYSIINAILVYVLQGMAGKFNLHVLYIMYTESSDMLTTMTFLCSTLLN